VVTPSPRSPRERIILKCVLVFVAVGLAVGGIVAVGNLARGMLADRDRYLFEFDAVECPIPPGLSRGQFLAEVQYLSGIPEKLSVVDADLPDALMLAFSRHPRVKSVGKVRVVSRSNVSIELTFVAADGP